jgi:hypothetical protein
MILIWNIVLFIVFEGLSKFLFLGFYVLPELAGLIVYLGDFLLKDFLVVLLGLSLTGFVFSL